MTTHVGYLEAMGWTRVTPPRSRELSEYARTEYGRAEAGWILAELESPRKKPQRRFRGRLRRWRASRRAARTPRRGAQASSMSGDAPVVRDVGAAYAASPASCDHISLEFLGSGGRTIYYRCSVCGRALIEEGNRRYVLRQTAREASDRTPQADVAGARPLARIA